jgi:alpha-beta hydrolase superfamily lysophospholipase
LNDAESYRRVEFPSEGAVLRGRLYLPPSSRVRHPVVIMAHGFSATLRGMTADNYAEAFRDAGFAALLYDHRNFGISGGEPRQQINRWVQARGFRDAITRATTLPEVDPERIAIWGDSMSASEAILVGAVDARVKAVVVQVPALGDEPPPAASDGSRFAAIAEAFQRGDVRENLADVVGPMPVVSFDQHGTPSLLEPLTAFRWFIEYGGRHGTGWQNWASLATPATAVPFHAVTCAPNLKGALLMMISPEDEMPGASPRIARMVFDAAPQPKELVEIDGGHFGLLYYPSPLFDQASRAQCEFLLRHLA